MADARVPGMQGWRERVENLYFAYLFVLRATLKAAPLLEDIGIRHRIPRRGCQDRGACPQAGQSL